MKSFIIFLVFFIILLNNSCKKSGSKYYYINNAEIKKSVSFREGSYFIYKDSISGFTDSIWIYQTYNYMFDINQGSGDEFAVEKCEYHLINNDSILGKVETIACNNGCENYFIYAFPACDLHTLSQNCIVYGTQFRMHQKIGHASGYTIYQQYYDSLFISNKMYYKVYQSINRGAQNLHPSDSTTLTSYYSLEQGQLKYSVKTDTSYHVWEIVKNKIIK
ncbi:MAG: hypothetical protein IPJ31_00260 [Bacteroidetes bacterium]|nr:hypothetical protein [Bacteroidota bacterium]